MPRKSAPVTAYALEWGNRHSRWIDTSSIERKRSDAWKHATSAGSTDAWKAEVKRRRRRGDIKAVKVVILTDELYRHLRGEQPARRRNDDRTLDLFEQQAT